jgi:hypothetical protein
MPALPLLTALLLTQAAPADSLPFHRGEWVAQFAGGLNFGSVGVLKFRSPHKALVLDIRIEGGHGEDVATDSTGTHFDGVGSHADLVLRFGWRRYHPAGPKVAAYHSWGLLAGFTHSVAVQPGFRSIANGWNGGVFGDIGGSYFLTPRLSVGATISGVIRYTDVYEQPNGAGKRRAWSIDGAAGGFGFVAALSF